MDKRIIKRAVILAVSVFIFIAVPPVHASTYVSPSVFFGFGTGSYVNFNTAKTLTSIYRENGFWFFNGYGFYVANGNLTVKKLMEGLEIAFTVSGRSGTQGTCKLKVPSKPHTVTVNGQEWMEGYGWNWNPTENILTVMVTYASSVDVVLSWQTPPTGGPPVTPPTPTPPSTPPVEPFPPPPIAPSDARLIFIVAVAGGAVALMVYRQKSGGNPVKLWKRKRVKTEKRRLKWKEKKAWE